MGASQTVLENTFCGNTKFTYLMMIILLVQIKNKLGQFSLNNYSTAILTSFVWVESHNVVMQIQ